ncbi:MULTISPECIES: LysM peptidoglycan-binding domain-containing protein [Streptomycetaceae]|uniref:Transglycosylase domain protein n=1 Tax=Streptantibioticus cattleyicolor (strain ATCC 35852 / DSM 46488 / JCM 4925 / NBRC 14057 / NRRL 8057) TaxID=1003195 RepID=F8JWA0_STREN|nr:MULTISPECIES: transglycosylase family protein [Streptomycetaceae]AEW94469.1 Transglycosylase domain protein [Streptantibioticus cattleyicolor NRRL 8057 = DSM 46488]MYS59114.1 LysM peptidoglycan-binding domain-containing protein [Streptomyces sp. SID5468]CCB74825.1 putative secreted protein [Streptantibioticus cattleyicolor NRRL 8057 = DSM 46488]
MGKHRRASKAVRIATFAGVAGAAVAAPLLSATSASAASVSVWDRVAQCESSGNWSNHDTGGNGHYGGLQFSPSSWAAAGGLKYASRADYATKDQQIAVAEQLLKMQGPGAWQCAYAGPLTSGGPAPAVDTAGSGNAASAQTDAVKPAKPAAPAPTQHRHAPRHAAPAAPVQRGTGEYTVQAGDTLSKIAADHQVAGGWQKLFDLNKDVVKDANLIFPGQHLHLR